MKDGHLFSEYRMRDSVSGRDSEAAVGLRNGWQLTTGIRLNTNAERITTIGGPPTTTQPPGSGPGIHRLQPLEGEHPSGIPNQFHQFQLPRHYWSGSQIQPLNNLLGVNPLLFPEQGCGWWSKSPAAFPARSGISAGGLQSLESAFKVRIPV